MPEHTRHTDPGDAGVISDALASIPAILRYIPGPEMVVACLPLAGGQQVDAALVIDNESELTQAGAQITGFLTTALAAGADRMIVAIGVIYPDALLTAQPGFAFAKQLSARLEQYQIHEVAIVVSGGFTNPGRWAQLGHLDHTEPARGQLDQIGIPIPPWSDHHTFADLMDRGQTIAPSQSAVGAYWSHVLTPPVGSGAAPGDSAQLIPEAQQTLIGFTEIIETLAHQGRPTADPGQLGRIATGLEHMLQREPLLGFAMAPQITAHPDQAYQVLSLLVPLTRGAGRSHLLDWATIAALLSGQQRSAEAALTAVAQSTAADGPTELSAMLYGSLAGGHWVQTLPVILRSGTDEMLELPDYWKVPHILHSCAEAASAAGHPDRPEGPGLPTQ